MDSIQDEIIEEFSGSDDRLDEYDYLIGLSETLPAIAPEHRTETVPDRGLPVAGVGGCETGRTAGCTTRPTATP